MSDLMYNQKAVIKVFGIGGAGCNAVNRMVSENVQGVEFYVCNTDMQVLDSSNVSNRIILGQNITKGLGAGSNPEIGKKAALESEEEIRKAMQGADMVFLAAGM
ncbi:MAG: cell division protein FtsZ, partial [Erysipelotrichaceae bacterium]